MSIYHWTLHKSDTTRARRYIEAHNVIQIFITMRDLYCSAVHETGGSTW